MKYVDSGEGKMPLITLIGILSISLTINLPGLAVSPMLGHLRHVFHSTELESQLLTALPNLVMIPIVIIAGRIATPKWQTAVLVTGLLIFFAAGVGSLVADSMGLLIFLGCMVGVGCGLVVPIAAGAISEWFIRKPRQRDLGLKSTTSNTMVIIANVFVGAIALISWHAAFAVYLVPIIPLLLVPFMTRKYIMKHRIVVAPSQQEKDQPAPYHFQGSESVRLLIGLIVLYVLLTYSTTSISYYAPFMMEKYGMNTTQVGVMTAAYYLMVAVSGAIVASMKRVFGRPVMFICLAICAAGLIVIGFTKSFWLMTFSSLCIGFAYGIIEPIIYNKTTYIAPTQADGMKYFGYVLSSNYLSIMMVPFVDSFFRKIFHSTEPGFEFVFSGVVVAMILVWALISRKQYVFAVNPATAAPSPEEIAQAEAKMRAEHGEQAVAGGIEANPTDISQALQEAANAAKQAAAAAQSAARAAQSAEAAAQAVEFREKQMSSHGPDGNPTQDKGEDSITQKQ